MAPDHTTLNTPPPTSTPRRQTRTTTRHRRVLPTLAHSTAIAILAAYLTTAPATAQNTTTATATATTALACDTSGVEQFSDITDGDYAAEYILCAKALQLTKGTKHGTFNPHNTLTRAQMAAFLARLWRGHPQKTLPHHPHTQLHRHR